MRGWSAPRNLRRMPALAVLARPISRPALSSSRHWPSYRAPQPLTRHNLTVLFTAGLPTIGRSENLPGIQSSDGRGFPDPSHVIVRACALHHLNKFSDGRGFQDPSPLDSPLAASSRPFFFFFYLQLSAPLCISPLPRAWGAIRESGAASHVVSC